MGINIAIDGTAGSGKGTTSEMLSKILGFYHLDTGAIFRAVAYKCVKEKIDFKDEKKVDKVVKNIDFKVVFHRDEKANQVQNNILDGEELGQKIRTEQISEASSIISQYGSVRNFAKEMQLKIAKKYDLIMEGRDIGTVILPRADFKFFLTASPEERARRRIKQLSLPENEYENVVKQMKERDKRDMERELAPLKVAEDAIYIDNTNMSLEQTVQTMLNFIKK